jgi:hypothetical protein
VDLDKIKTDTKLFGYLLIGLGIFSAFAFLFVFGFVFIFFLVLIGWVILTLYYLRFLVRFNFTARVIAIILAVLITVGLFYWAYNTHIDSSPVNSVLTLNL